LKKYIEELIVNLKNFINQINESEVDIKKHYDNSKEKTYEKMPNELNFEIAEKDRKVTTFIDGKQEKTNTAKAGDYILTGVKGEKYVSTPEKFNSKYIVKGDKAVTKPVRIKAAPYFGKELSFKAPWGETMIVNSGDFLVNADDGMYRIEKEIFPKTYKKIG